MLQNIIVKNKEAYSMGIPVYIIVGVTVDEDPLQTRVGVDVHYEIELQVLKIKSIFPCLQYLVGPVKRLGQNHNS